MLKILLRIEYPEQHALALTFAGTTTAHTGALDVFNAPSFQAFKRRYAVLPAALPKASEKVLSQMISPDKKQMPENMKLFTGSYSESNFLPVFLNTVFCLNLMVFPIFCLPSADK